VTERWIGVALAATSVGQLLLSEPMSRKTGEFGQRFFNNVIAGDKRNELGLPDEPERRSRLTDQVYSTAELAAAGATVLAAEVAAFAGLLATHIIAAQAEKAEAAWISGVAALIIITFAAGLVIQLLSAKLSKYVIGERVRRQKKTKSDEPSWRRRYSNNMSAAIGGYFSVSEGYIH
jgi:hypothetical protein